MYTHYMYDTLIENLVARKAARVTYYKDDKHIIRIVRTKYKYNRGFSRGNLELTITEGKPNFVEREFIKRTKKDPKAGSTTFGSIFPFASYKSLPRKDKSKSNLKPRSKAARTAPNKTT